MNQALFDAMTEEDHKAVIAQKREYLKDYNSKL